MMAARMCKYVKCIETLPKAYKFNDKAPISILRFLAQIKRACDSIGVSKCLALLIMSTVVKDKPGFCLTVQMTFL